MAVTQAQEALVRKVLRRVDADDGGAGAVVDYDMVYDALEEAAIYIIENAPRHLLFGMATDYSTEANTECAKTADVVTIPVPADYRRLLQLELEGWTRQVTNEDVEVVAGDNYADVSRKPALASVDRPRVFHVYVDNSAVSTYTAADTSLKCFPGTTATTAVEAFVYVPAVAPTSFDSKLEEPLLWKAGHLAFYAIDPELSALCENRYQHLIKSKGQRRTVTGSRRLAWL